MLNASGSAIQERPITTQFPLWIFRGEGDDAVELRQCAQALHLNPRDCGEVTASTELVTVLTDESAVVLLPALEDDCLGIKLAQQVIDHPTPYAVALYGKGLPAKDYLCLAYRTGLDDIIDVKGGHDTLDVQLRRLGVTLYQRQRFVHETDEFQSEAGALARQCDRLQRDNDRWQERLISLANTAKELAIGRRRMAIDTPRLLIVAASPHQAETALQVAGELGFDCQQVSNAQAALEDIQSRPPAVILVDSVLPDQELSTFVKSARHVCGNQPMTIIAWSSNPESEDELLTPATEIDDFVLKSSQGEGILLLTAALLGSLR